MRRKRWRAQSKAFSKTEPEKDELKRNHEAWKRALNTQSALAMVVIGSARCLDVALQDGRHDHRVLGVVLGCVLGRKTSWLVRNLF